MLGLKLIHVSKSGHWNVINPLYLFSIMLVKQDWVFLDQHHVIRRPALPCKTYSRVLFIHLQCYLRTYNAASYQLISAILCNIGLCDNENWLYFGVVLRKIEVATYQPLLSNLYCQWFLYIAISFVCHLKTSYAEWLTEVAILRIFTTANCFWVI